MHFGTIEKAVDSAGYELQWAELSASGVLTKEPSFEALVLALRSHQGTILVVPGTKEATQRNYVEISRWAGTNSSLRITGRAHTHEGGRTAMTVTSFSVLKDPTR